MKSSFVVWDRFAFTLQMIVEYIFSSTYNADQILMYLQLNEEMMNTTVQKFNIKKKE